MTYFRDSVIPSGYPRPALLKYLRRTLPYLRPYKRLVVFTVIFAVLSSLIVLATPWPLKILVDNVLGGQQVNLPFGIGDHTYHLLALVAIAGLTLTLAENLISVLSNYVQTRLMQQLTLDFRGEMFQHAQRLSLSFHDRKRSGMVVYALYMHGDAIALLLDTLLPLAQAAIVITGMLWITIRIDLVLGLLSLTVVPVLYLALRYYSNHIQQKLRDIRTLEGESVSVIHEAMAMLKVIAAFGREDHEFRRYRDQGQRALDKRVDITVRQTLFSLVVNLNTALGTWLVLGLGAVAVLNGQLTVGELLVFMSYIKAMYQPMEQITHTFGSLQDTLIALQLAFGLLDTKPDITDKPGAIPISTSSGAISFEHVTFGYQGRRHALRDVSFDVNPGQVVAVVGATGAGKTTLISLIPRFYDPQHGQVLLDGVDIRDLTVSSLRQQISIVLQDPLLFSTTIIDNIRYGRLDASYEDVVEAAKAANAHDFISRLPKQYDTELGERGAQLSGGERQRIAVARAFLRQAPVLILDEPTSSIDSKTEQVILEALERLMRGRTTFMVAHRLSTIRNADLILVIDKGELVQVGSHDKLIAEAGVYRQLHDAQSARPAVKRSAPGLRVAPNGSVNNHSPSSSIPAPVSHLE